jgi:hypothetical protein
VEKSHHLSATTGKDLFNGRKFSPENIHQHDCKAAELIQAANGHFTAENVFWNPNPNIPTVSNKVPWWFALHLIN